jgi:hypothetical protein
MGIARRALPIALTAALVMPSIVWVVLDRSIWPWDPSWYGEVSVDLWAAARGGTHWPGVMTHAFGAKPPAIAWFGQFFVPLRHVVGGYSVAFLLSVVVCQAITIWLLFQALTRLGGHRAGIVGALSLGSAPLFIAMSHEYFAEPIQTVATGWILLILASASAWRPALVLAQIPGAIAFGLLAKFSTPLYIAAPCAGAIFLVFRCRRRTFVRKAHRDVAVVTSVIGSALLVVGALSWYSVNLHAAIAHARAASADTGLYGVNRGFWRQFQQWLSYIRDVTFLPHFGLAVAAISVAALVVAVRQKRRISIIDPRSVCALASVTSVLLVLASFATQPNEDPRYLLPLIPYLAMLVGLAVAAPVGALLPTVLGVVLVIQFAGGTLQSFDIWKPSWLVSYPIPAPVQKTAIARTLDEIVNQTCTPASSFKINMVGVNYPWFNANTLQMLAAERFAESGRYCYYTALGYASTDPNAAWRRVVQFKPPFYIGLDYGNAVNPLPLVQRRAIDPKDPFNVINVAVFRRAIRSKAFVVLPETRRAGTVVLAATPTP